MSCRGSSDGAMPLTAAVLAQRDIGVAVCNAEGLLVEQNDALAEMLGTPYRPMHAAEWCDHFHLYAEDGQHELGAEGSPLARALRGEHVVDDVIAVRRPGRPARYLRCNGTRIHSPDGDLAGAVVFIVDATAAVQARRELDTLRENLIETVNHELRTPAAALRGHVELLSDLRAELPADAAWSLDALARNLERMQTVLDRISDIAEAVTRASGSEDAEALDRHRAG